jgi:hypothetical protein
MAEETNSTYDRSISQQALKNKILAAKHNQRALDSIRMADHRANRRFRH